ncbi:hypothetical protein [Streptomyces sp. NPDC058612]
MSGWEQAGVCLAALCLVSAVLGGLLLRLGYNLNRHRRSNR